MKTKFFSITVLCLIVNLASLAQPYRSVFAKDTTQWNVVYEVMDMFPTIIYKAFGDTIIENKDYKFINKGYWNWFGEKCGYMREDIATGKLWIRSLDNNERLIMDLSLNKNDSFAFETGQKYSVDTIFYREGRKYLSFNKKNSRDSLLFIEGIGSSSFYDTDIFTYFHERAIIRCKFEDNILIYHNAEYVNCFDTITGGINENHINKFTVYPNPTANFITIQSDLKYPYKIEFFNNMGLKVLEQIMNDKGPVYLYNLPSGMYFLRITTKNQYYLSKLLKL